MVKRTGPTNVHLRKLIVGLKKTKSPVWKDVAEKLESPRRKRATVNVGEINMHAKPGETVVVPGVVLAKGEMDKGVKVAAWRFSGAAAEKIEKAEGKALSIGELLKSNPKGSGIRIMV